MISFNNQQVVLEALKSEYQKLDDRSCQILNAPGICDGIINKYHRYAIKAMKSTNEGFSLNIAIAASKKLSQLFNDIKSGKADVIQKSLGQLCYFQAPRQKQPEDSFCQKDLNVTIGDIPTLNRSYNQKKYQSGKNKQKFISDQQIQNYLEFYNDVHVSQDFAGCIDENDLAKMLAYYLPIHANEIIRIGVADHVISIGYHVDNQAKVMVSILDPNYDINNPLRLIEVKDLNRGIRELIEALKESFYNEEFNYDEMGIDIPPFNGNFSLSFKSYAIQKPNNPTEKDGATLLLELLAIEPEKEEACDNQAIDSLFICSEYGHEKTARALLNRYGDSTLRCKTIQMQGRKVRLSPTNVSEQQGHEKINELFRDHYRHKIAV
ncbi:MAG: hypothetical protein JSS07_07935 [Proteobacteria bacterium]|nr:hypothetical protein [Pseudomonadota bacterium]